MGRRFTVLGDRRSRPAGASKAMPTARTAHASPAVRGNDRSVVRGRHAGLPVRRVAIRERASNALPARSLLVVDLENLVGRWACMRRRDLVLATRQVFAELPEAHFVTVAANGELFARVLPVLPKGGRLRAAAGRVDEADLLLLEELETIPAAVDHVVIASGDHAFLAACRSHQRAGRTVEVVARPGSVSSRLAHAADAVTFLSETTLAIAA